MAILQNITLEARFVQTHEGLIGDDIVDLDEIQEITANLYLDGSYVDIVPRLEVVPQTVLPDVILGDLTGDGTVGMTDLILMKRFFAGHDVDINLAAADINGDGVVDMTDLILFMRYFTVPGTTLGPQR